MNVIITGRRYNVSSGLKNTIEQKLKKIKHFYNHVLSFHVIIEKEKLNHKAEITFRADGKKFCIKDVAPTVHEVVDSLIDKLERQIRKHKEKLQDHKHVKKFTTTGSEEDLSDNIQFLSVEKVQKKELDVLVQLSISEKEYDAFYEDDKYENLSVAIKNEADNYTVISKNKENGKWTKKIVYLADEKIEKTELADYEYITCTVNDAVTKLNIGKYGVVVFNSSDDNLVHAMAFGKDGDYEMVTLGN